MRLDMFLANAGLGTRRDVKEFLKQKRVKVDGEMVKEFGHHIDENKSKVEVDGKLVEYKKYRYYMLNKPDGYITATEDKRDQVVMDLLDIPNKKDYFPVGRLDKDTEGLLIITNDGGFLHDVLSPKKHVPKTYFATLDGIVTEEHVKQFKEGITIDDGYKCMPATLSLEGTKQSQLSASEANITIYEGKFHQVKRMFEAIGMNVVYLKRVAMGNLKLDESLKLGEYKELESEDIEMIRG